MIQEEHWREVLDGMPMPPDATPEMMWAAYDALQEIKERDESLVMLKWYQKSKERQTETLEFMRTQTTIPNYHDRIKAIEQNLVLIDEGIELLRERLID